MTMLSARLLTLVASLAVNSTETSADFSGADTTTDAASSPETTTTMGDSFKSMISGAGKNPFESINARVGGHWDILTNPKILWDVVSQAHIVWAGIFMIIGGLCVLNGFKWHKMVIILLAAMLGLYTGAVMGAKMGSSNVVAICCAVLFAVLAWPMLRYAVALFAGLAGAFAGANVWTSIGLIPEHHQYGAVIGLVAMGMLAFMAFRPVVIVLTTIGGASMLILGALAALANIAACRSGLQSSISDNHLLVPILTASTAVVGAVYQFSGGVSGMNAMANKANTGVGAAPAAAKKAA